ncbi:protein of unknown function [Nitrospina watsonii]|uniref:Uncharacterized protein n=1 Tax=Nitrospina watsonii TaxID=1323948 RepID=A0ABM9HBF8_9BACT|nr:protein of unknown function [Nitrospina watsonii]
MIIGRTGFVSLINLISIQLALNFLQFLITVTLGLGRARRNPNSIYRVKSKSAIRAQGVPLQTVGPRGIIPVRIRWNIVPIMPEHHNGCRWVVVAEPACFPAGPMCCIVLRVTVSLIISIFIFPAAQHQRSVIQTPIPIPVKEVALTVFSSGRMADIKVRSGAQQSLWHTVLEKQFPNWKQTAVHSILLDKSKDLYADGRGICPETEEIYKYNNDQIEKYNVPSLGQVIWIPLR